MLVYQRVSELLFFVITEKSYHQAAAEDKARRYDDLNESTLHRRKFRKQRLDAIQMLEAWGSNVFFIRT